MTAAHHFNTSHVTVYHLQNLLHMLSFLISIHLMLRFIVNSQVLSVLPAAISIHLMLRFIFSGTSRTCAIYINFNTSHVTVYQYHCLVTTDNLTISIHLMLRFINPRNLDNQDSPTFQYISCYGLSEAGEH